MRKPDFCICENKDADQLRGNREADQRLCFRYTDSTIPLLLKSKISSLKPSSVTVQPGLCQTWSETPKTGFLITRLKCGDQTVLLLFAYALSRFSYDIANLEPRHIFFYGMRHEPNKDSAQPIYDLSLVVRKPVFGVSDEVRHKPSCTAIEDGYRLEISDLGRRGIVLSV